MQLSIGDDGQEHSDWGGSQKPPRDLKKVFLVAGLGALSWVATFVGMLELIEANMGDLPLIHKVIVGFSVAMLMTMIIWLLDQMFSQIPFTTKLLYGIGYVFLSIISIGFGFGFYWKVLESRSEASRSAESAVGQVQGSLYAASTRLDQLQSTLTSLTAISRQKADIERQNGTSCPNSKPGDGPRRKMRDDDAARFSYASDFVKTRGTQVKTELTALDEDLAKIVKSDPATFDARTGTRNEFMKGLGRKLDMTVTGFNAFRGDPQLKQIRADLAERAEKTSFIDTKGAAYACPDAQLQSALRGVVRAIDQLPEIEKPKIAAVEGAEATIEAFRRLTATFYGLISFKLPPSADEMRELQKKAVLSAESGALAKLPQFEQAGLSKRDYVPLAVAIFVDICLLLVSMGRPLNVFASIQHKMKEAESGPIYRILQRFYLVYEDERQKDVRICPLIDVLHHVIYEANGKYHAAVPLSVPKYVLDEDHRGGKARFVRVPVPEPASRAIEVRALSTLFASLEPFGIYRRTPSLYATMRVRHKLRAQASYFAEAPGFRIYTFGNNRWPEMILGAIMGAARRVEQRNKAQAEAAPQLREPPLEALEKRLRQEETRWPEEAPKPKHGYRRRPIEAVGATFGADPELARAFADYDAREQAERARQQRTRSGLETIRPGMESAESALPRMEDGKTEPRPAPRAPAGEREAASGGGDNVVHIGDLRPGQSPAASISAPQGPFTASAGTSNTLRQALAVAEQEPLPRIFAGQAAPAPTVDADQVVETPEARLEPKIEPRVDVTMRERTVTFSVPAADGRLPDAITGLGDEPAIDALDPTDTLENAVQSLAALAAPQVLSASPSDLGFPPDGGG